MRRPSLTAIAVQTHYPEKFAPSDISNFSEASMSNKHSVGSKPQPETDDIPDAIGKANEAREMFKQINQAANAFMIGQTEKKYEFLEIVYVACCDFSRRDSDWEVFTADPFFDTNQQKPKAYADEPFIAKWVIYFAAEARTSKARKAVGKAARVLQHFFDEGCHLDEMMLSIKGRGGITAVYEDITKENFAATDLAEDDAGDWDLFPFSPRTPGDEEIDSESNPQWAGEEGWGEENAVSELSDAASTDGEETAPDIHNRSSNSVNSNESDNAERGKPISKRIDLTTTLAVEMAESDIAKILGAKRATVSIEITSPTKESAFTRVVSKRVQVGDDNQ
jgi:hypothetical protein